MNKINLMVRVTKTDHGDVNHTSVMTGSGRKQLSG